MIHIPEEREKMSNAQVRELLLEIAEYINGVSDQLLAPRLPTPTERVEYTSSKDFNYAPWSEQKQAPKENKWTKGRITNALTNRAGIQWKIDQLSDEQKAEILEDDSSLLSNQSIKNDNEPVQES